MGSRPTRSAVRQARKLPARWPPDGRRRRFFTGAAVPARTPPAVAPKGLEKPRAGILVQQERERGGMQGETARKLTSWLPPFAAGEGRGVAGTLIYGQRV